MKKFRTAVLIPIIALLLVGFSAAVFADTTSDAVGTEESYTSTVTLNAVTLPKHSSYVSDAYFGVINVTVGNEAIAAATSDTQGHVVITAVDTGSTTVTFWFKALATDNWKLAKVPITVSDTAAKVTTTTAGLVFPKISDSVVKNSTYTVTDIVLNGLPVDAKDLLWVSSDNSIFTVESSTGTVTGVSEGTAVLYGIDPKTNAATNITITVL